MARSRVTGDELEWAATWLDEYEAGDDEGPDGPGATFARVAEWLRHEAAVRRDEAIVRDLVKKTGATPAHARAVYREHKQTPDKE